jgi:hypothetical protein
MDLVNPHTEFFDRMDIYYNFENQINIINNIYDDNVFNPPTNYYTNEVAIRLFLEDIVSGEIIYNSNLPEQNLIQLIPIELNELNQMIEHEACCSICLEEYTGRQKESGEPNVSGELNVSGESERPEEPGESERPEEPGEPKEPGELGESEGITQVCRIACGHHFHSNCVRTWLINHYTCPLCRTQL